ncbi:hypothetical protein V6L77_00120 [Pannonibacter sp. Pt2-lr]
MIDQRHPLGDHLRRGLARQPVRRAGARRQRGCLRLGLMLGLMWGKRPGRVGTGPMVAAPGQGSSAFRGAGQQHFGIIGQPAHLQPQGFGKGRRAHALTGALQQRIAVEFAQLRQHPAHGRDLHPHAGRRCRHAALRSSASSAISNFIRPISTCALPSVCVSGLEWVGFAFFANWNCSK